MQNGADVNAVDEDGRTALHRAALSRSLDAKEVVIDLIRNDADVKAADKRGQTPLHTAVRSVLANAIHIINELVLNGPDIDAIDNKGTTPLHHAAHSLLWNAVHIIAEILQNGADPLKVESLWHIRQMPSDQILGCLETWKNAKNKHNYGTIDMLLNEASKIPGASMHCISWEWELPVYCSQ
jgi:ankyrin repeat protein